MMVAWKRAGQIWYGASGTSGGEEILISGGERPRTSLSARRLDDVDHSATVYALAGVFTDSKEAYAFLDRLRRDVQEGDGAMIIDLSGVTHMTSCGVGILAAAYGSTRDAGRPLALVGMSPRLLSVMRAVGLLSVVPHHETYEQAMAAIHSPGEQGEG